MPDLLKWNIPAMNDSDPLVPIKNPFRTLAQGTSDAFTAFQRGVAFTVASLAERNAIFPTPTQGNRVFRNDLGYEEMYYDIYSATGNPGGARARGWYPTGNNSAFGMLSRANVSVQLGGGAFNSINSASWWKQQELRGISAFNGGWTIPYEGIWNVSAGVYTAADTPMYVGITVNNTSPSTATFAAQSNRTSYAGNNTGELSRDLILNTGDILRLFVLVGATNLWNTQESSSWFNVKFNGIRRV